MKKRESTYVHGHIESWDTKARDIWLPPDLVYELTIDYPLDTPAIFKIKTGRAGLSTAGLMSKIAKCYYKVYKNEDKYGIWGHDLSDLHFEYISVNHVNKKISICVGS